jgi:hypothetical protein
MSEPKNPLDDYEGYSIKHLLVAFEFTESACKTKVPSMVGKVGDALPKSYCGKNVILINELEDPLYSVNKLDWTFSYFSPISTTTTALTGTLQVSSQVAGEFVMLLAKAAATFEMSVTHLTYWLRTAFVCRKRDGTDDILFMKPLIFHTNDLTYKLGSRKTHLFDMNFMATYNTFGQLPCFSGIHQMTITHKDGALHKEIPKPEAPNAEILTRVAEDALKAEARLKRMEKSKPMKTLQEVLDAFELELKEQRFAHKRQLQEWLDRVRTPGYVKKIEEVVQKKGDELPIDYILGLSGNLQFDIDNRNMPWEQPEQAQDKNGIRSLNIPPGKNIVTAIDFIMKLSKQAGMLAPEATWKTSLTICRRCGGKYDVFVVVNQAEVAKNSSGTDTGPGKSVVDKVLEFTINKPGAEDVDQTFIEIYTTSDIDYGILEDIVQEDEAEVVYGNREQITFERIPQKKYFKSLFSGVRGLSDPKNYGLEHASEAAKIDYSLSPYKMPQTTDSVMEIHGNPNLYSDLCRNPWKVKNRDPDNPALYKFPETYPIYMKVNVYIAPAGSTLGKYDDNASPKFYHEKHYHAHKITNSFFGSKFVQVLHLARIDDFT